MAADVMSSRFDKIVVFQTQVLPSKEIYNQTKEEISARLDFYMAGRVAEELVFGKDNITTC